MKLRSIARRVNRGSLITGIVIWGLFAPVFLPADEPRQAPDDAATRLAELQRKVEQAEKLYRDTDVHFREIVEYGTAEERAEWKNPETAKKNFSRLIDYHLSTHIVRQPPFLRVEEEGHSWREGGAEQVNKFEMEFDGQMMRSRRTMPTIVNAETVSKADKNVIYDWNEIKTSQTPYRFTLGPHLTLWNVADVHVAFSLSQLLTGDEAYSGLGPPRPVDGKLGLEATGEETEEKRFRVEYSGREVLDGYPCEKVSIHLPRFTTIVWLAENRNSLPVRLEFYRYDLPDHPASVARTLKFREVTPGVWYPVECESMLYRKKFSGNDANPSDTGTPEQFIHKQYFVDGLFLTPKYDQAYFEGILIPPGAQKNTVYDPDWTKQMQKTVQQVNSNRHQMAHRLVGVTAEYDMFLEDWIGDNGVSKIVRFCIALFVGLGGYLLLRRIKRRRKRKEDLLATPPENAAL